MDMETTPLHFSDSKRIYDEQKDQSLQRFITVRGDYDGFHWYEGAPEEVAFLKHRHAHLFKWEVTIEVFHDDRELEFFMVRDVIRKEILAFTNMLDNLGSCEMQAERLLQGLINAYGIDRHYTVTISEDGRDDGTCVWN